MFANITFILLILNKICACDANKLFESLNETTNTDLVECLSKYFDNQLDESSDVILTFDNKKRSRYFLNSVIENIHGKVFFFFNYKMLIYSKYDYNLVSRKEGSSLIIVMDDFNPDVIDFVDLFRNRHVHPLFVLHNKIDQASMKSLIKKCFDVGLYRTTIVLNKARGATLVRGTFTVNQDCSTSIGMNEILCSTISDKEMEKLSFPHRILDFKRCPVNVSSMIIPPSVMRTDDGEITGFETQLVRLIAEDMNFTPNVILRDDLDWGLIDTVGGRSSGITGDVYLGLSEIAYGVIWPTVHRETYLDGSVTYESDCFTWAIPPYVAKETLTEALFGYLVSGIDEICWFSIAFFSIVIHVALHFFAKYNEKSVEFGVSLLASAALFFQKPIPETFVHLRTSMKMLLVILSGYYLVVSNIYQGSLSCILVLPHHHRDITDIKELLASEMPIATSEDFMFTLKNLANETLFDEINRRIEVKMPSSKYLQQISDGRIMAYSRNKRTLKYYQDLHYKDKKCACDIFHIISECYVIYPIHLLFRKGSIMRRRANKVITRAKESGLIEFWIPNILKRGIKWDLMFNNVFEPENFAKLTNVLYIYFIGNSLALIIFLYELCYVRVLRLIYKWKMRNYTIPFTN